MTEQEGIRRAAEELVELLGPAQEEMLHRRKIFIQRARATAHEALFYLGMLYPTGRDDKDRAVVGYCGFALRQVASLWGRVKLAEGSLEATLPLLTAEAEGEPTPAARQIEKLEPAIEDWKAIGGKLHELFLPDLEVEDGSVTEVEGPTLDDAREIRKRFESFLDRSLPESFWERIITYRFFDGLRLARKRMTFLIATALVGLVVWNVEVVNSLLVDHRFGTLLVVLYLGAPSLYWLVGIWRRRKREAIPHWDVGGRPFRSLRHPALEPDELMRRWPERLSQTRIAVPVATAEEFVQDDPGFWKRLLNDLRPPESDGMVRLTHSGVNHRLKWTLIVWAVGIAVVFAWPRATSMTTVYSITALLMAVVWVARALDFWEFLEPLPIRLILLGFALLAGVGLWFGLEQYFAILYLAGAFLYWRWYRRNPRRTTRKRVAWALVACAALNVSGLITQQRAHWEAAGYRPPLFERALVWLEDEEPSKALERTDDWPLGDDEGEPVVVIAASGGGSRAAYYTGLTLERLHETKELRPIAKNIQAISSVSGGSLANAAYVVRRYRAARSGGSAVTSTDDLTEALRQDFIRYTLWGLLAPGLNRGDGIEQAWQGFEPRVPKDYLHFHRYPCGTTPDLPMRDDNVGLGNLCLGDLADVWRAHPKNEPPPFPMPLFNTTSLDGHNIVVSPLAKELYTNPRLHRLADDRPVLRRQTWVFDRDGIYGLEDVLPDDYNTHISAAVRASANFPFGFPLVRVRSHEKLFFSPRAKPRDPRVPKQIDVTDGGALSNSGMFSLYNLLINRSAALRERGVLLIIVDASKMPSYPDFKRKKMTNLAGAISDQSPIGQQLHRRMYDLLQAVYGDMIAVSKIDLTPEEPKNVLTTWALSSKSVKLLRNVFKERWAEEGATLAPKWRHLVAANRDRRKARTELAALRELPPAERAGRLESLLSRALGPEASRTLSPVERRMLQVLRDRYLAPSNETIDSLTITDEQNRALALVSHDRPPLD